MGPDKLKFESVIGVPAGAVRASIELGRTMLQQTRDIFMPQQSSAELSEHLAVEHPLAEADLGIRTMEYGEKKGDPELVFNGEAILAKAVIKAADNEDVPDEVTKEIVELVVDRGIDVELTPLLTDEVVERVVEITEDFRQ